MNDENILQERIDKRLKFIYKERHNPGLTTELLKLVQSYKGGKHQADRKWSEKDIILITYGDSIRKRNEPPLKTLRHFLERELSEEISIVHILPFFPYTSDDGFSVVDYLEVNPELGNWQHIAQLGENRDLMFDLVINHISGKSEWFQNFRKGKRPGKDYFIEQDPDEDLSEVVRPRSLPLLTKVSTSEGAKYVWTTFSDDQIDLNFANPGLMLEMMKVLLEYIRRGARIIRLDAIAFLWKKPGTSCIHLPETHEVVKLMRDIAEMVDPSVIILTETNVPNEENLSYFGNGDEAHMVYQFSLPPLLLHALFKGDPAYLNEWASSVPVPPEGCTYFNFTASHDGIGVRPLEGLLPESEKQELMKAMQQNGGLVSTRKLSDGTDAPYELNITYFDAMKQSHNGLDGYQAERFIASQTMMMAMQGIPAFYIHSLTSTPNYFKGVEETGRARTINRRKWELDNLDELLQKDKTHRFIFNELKRRIRIRRSLEVFHPENEQIVIPGLNGIFALIRVDRKNKNYLVSVTNLKDRANSVQPAMDLKIDKPVKDLLTGSTYDLNQFIYLKPYQTLWLYNGG
jgi:sucrose phosphorylase